MYEWSDVMCEACDIMNSFFGKDNKKQSTSNPGITGFGQVPISIFGTSDMNYGPYWRAKVTTDDQPGPNEETDELPDPDDFSPEGRDVAGYLRITCKMGQAKLLEPLSLTAMYIMYGVPNDEWDDLNKLAEAYKNDAPTGKFEDIMTQQLIKAFSSR
jgi:hypothetical protein